MRPARVVDLGRALPRLAAVDSAPIEELLGLHERLFGPLDPEARIRMTASARKRKPGARRRARLAA